MIAESCRWLRPLSELLTTPLQPSLLLAHNIDNIGIIGIIGIIIIANFAKFNIAIPVLQVDNPAVGESPPLYCCK